MTHVTQPPQPPYGSPQFQPMYGAVPDHPKATTVLVLGILGLVVCGVVAPFAWSMGNQVIREIDAAQGGMGGRSSAQAGRICGIIGTVLLAFSVLAVVAVVGLAVVGTTSSNY